MQITKRELLIGGVAALALPGQSNAQAPDKIIRLGILTDMNGTYKDLTGPTSVACTRQAVEEFTKQNPDIAVEITVADHMNNPTGASGIVREWIDRQNIDVVTNLGSSAVALACNTVITDKNKVHLNTAGGSSGLTGESCSPNLVHWTYDTWNTAHSIAAAVVKSGGDSWYFVIPNYAFGITLRDNASKLINASGGKILGSVAFPFPGTTDFASYLLQAQGSGAKVVAFAAAGGDLVNCLKQAREFQITKGDTTLVALSGFITDYMAMGLDVGRNIIVCENFYWDLNDRTRAFYKRVKDKIPGVFPNMNHAGDYAGVLHYLKTVKEMGVTAAKASGRETVAMMKKMPTDDDCFGAGRIREDGRKIHPSYLFRVKGPDKSKYPGDVYELFSTIPADEAFRPLQDGNCPMIKL